MKSVPLTQGKIALVDEEDFEYINQWKWCYRQGYAIRGEYLGRVEGKSKTKTISMHRLINSTANGLDTDHINGDKLDNRRSNLRSCEHRLNTQNRLKGSKITASKYKGVSWISARNAWQAYIRVNYKHWYLGLYDKEADAANAYNKVAHFMFGEYAALNTVTA